MVVLRDPLAEAIPFAEDATVPLSSLSLSSSSSIITTAVEAEFDDADAVDTTVVLPMRLCEYIIFKSSIVGLAFSVVERRFKDVLVRGEGGRETKALEESFAEESCVDDEGTEAFLCGELLCFL